jgi:hypothetical protein
MDQVKLTAYINEEMAYAILDDYAARALFITNAYYIYDAQGATKVGSEVWMGSAKVFVCYCNDQPKAIQIKNRIMELAEIGQTIGFEMVTVPTYTFTREE